MLLIYRISLFAITIAVFTSASCRKGGQCEGAFNIVNQSEVVVTFKDQATGNYLYAEINPQYNKDSLKVFDPLGNSLIILSALNQIPNSNNRYYVLSFGNIYNSLTDESSFNTEICKNYVIKYLFNETDTVQVCFKSQKTKCGSKFETIKVFHGGQQVGFATNAIGISVTIFKN